MFKITRRILSSFIIVSLIVGVISISAYAASGENFPNSFWGYSKTSATPIYANSNMSGSPQDELGMSEGVTILNSTGNKYYIEYGTPSGTRRGYVYQSQMGVDSNYTRGGIVTSSTTVYYWSDASSLPAGSVYSGEIVSVLSKDNGWYYIEYNVNAAVGRKRGYVPTSKVTVFGSASVLQSNWRDDYISTDYQASGLGSQYNVYAMPNTNTYNGLVTANEQIWIVTKNISINGTNYWFVRYIYTVGGANKIKSGYIIHN